MRDKFLFFINWSQNLLNKQQRYTAVKFLSTQMNQFYKKQGLLKLLQNKKGQKNLGYPRKK